MEGTFRCTLGSQAQHAHSLEDHIIMQLIIYHCVNSLDTIHGRHAFAQTTIHTANRILANIILISDNHNILKGKMHSKCMLLPVHIVCTITQRDNIRREHTCDPALKLLNEEITSDIQKHKQHIWKEHLDAHLDHRHNTHILWKVIHGLSNRAHPPTLNTSITFNNKI